MFVKKFLAFTGGESEREQIHATPCLFSGSSEIRLDFLFQTLIGPVKYIG